MISLSGLSNGEMTFTLAMALRDQQGSPFYLKTLEARLSLRWQMSMVTG